MDFVNDCNPTRTALYLVDRGMQGKHYRWYNAEKDQWSLCAWSMEEAIANQDIPSGVDFYPWVGPLTGKGFDPNKPVKVVTDGNETPAKQSGKKTAKVAAPAKKMAKQRTVKVATPKTTTKQRASKSDYPDGTVWFREDRQKWIAQWNGKQEAARPTKEACLSFLKKKYDVVGTVIDKE